MIFCCYRSPKSRNRPSFRQILMHLEIASHELLDYEPEDFVKTQVLPINLCFEIPYIKKIKKNMDKVVV